MKQFLLSVLFLLIIQTVGICQHWERLNYNSFSFYAGDPSMISKDGQLFLASEGGIYKSEDNGGHWVYSSNGLNTPLSNVIYDIFSDETGIYCANAKGIFKSVDNGANWKESGEGLVIGAYVSYAKIFRLNDKLFLYQYKDNKQGKLFVSSDNAQHWLLAVDDLSFKYIYMIGSSIYGVDGSSIKKSNDGYLFSDYPSTISSNIHGISGANEDLFAIGFNQLYHSVYGGTLEPLSVFPETETPGSINYLNNQFILTTSTWDSRNFFLYYSSDKGKSWQSFNKNGLEGQTIQGLFYLNEQYIALTDIGLYLLKEGSNAWVKATNGLRITSAFEFTVSGNVIIIRDSNGISISKDKGETWTTSLENKPMGEEYYIDELINSGKYLFARTNKTIYKSENHGESWSKITIPYANPIEGYFYFETGVGDTLILSFEGIQGYGQYVSLDGGVNWNFVTSGNYQFQYLFLNNNVLFAARYLDNGGKKLMRSYNYGQTWEFAGGGLDSIGNYINIIVSGERNTFYLTSDVYNLDNETSGSTLYKSNDNGYSWTKVDVTNSSDFFWIIDMKYYDNALYVSYAEGIARSIDGGESWEEIRGDLPGEIFGTLAFMNDEVYCGTYTHGIWKSTVAPLSIYNKGNSNKDLLIYPNPASDYTNVKSINGNGIVMILNMQGEVVKEINAESDKVLTRVQISDIRAGIYLLKYESEGKSFSEKLIIVK